VKEPLPNLALSNAIRPGVAGWLRTLARELGPDGVTVNTIAPGRIDTERLRAIYPDGLSDRDLESIPLRRAGTAAEVANVIEREEPGVMLPVSQLPEDVAVCVAVSIFAHVTVSPARIVTVLG